MVKKVCIIQSRMGSQRLPQKSLMPLGGKPMLQHVLERALKSRLVDEVILATTQKNEDDALAQLAESLGCTVFRGADSDLIDRYFHAAKQADADIVLRIPADNPLVHPDEIDRAINHFIENNFDFTSNLGPYLDNGYPDGLGTEVMSFSVLKDLHQKVSSPHHREHVTSFFRDESNSYRCGSCLCPNNISRPDIILDVNTQDEYNFMNRLITKLESSDDEYNIQSIISNYDQLIGEDNVRK